VVFVPALAVGEAGVPVKVGLAKPAKPALGNVTAALPDPSSGEIVIEPFALFNLIDIVFFLSYNTSPLA
jgi:sirohydrochlorin ferrochelatase